MAANTTYFVDCTGGKDTNSGGPNAPWKSLTRANTAILLPGQQLLLRRGCTWDGQRLDASWTGTPAAPVVIGAYGLGSDPVIKNGLNQDVDVTGAWQVIEGIWATVDPKVYTACGEPIGDHVGFNVKPSAHDDTIQYVTASREMAGVHVSEGAKNNHVLHSLLTGNNMVTRFHADPSLDLGAWGILVEGDYNDIGWNDFEKNIAVCSNHGYKLASNSVELFVASGNTIHHNISVGDRVFSELGGSHPNLSSNNTYAYNVFVTTAADSRFITTRGARDKWGPVLNTVVYHNSTYQTGAGSQGIVCGGGCGPTVLTANSNIVWAEQVALYVDGTCPVMHDLFWSSNKMPVIEAPRIDPSNIIADPRYTKRSASDLRLQNGSPAGDEGIVLGNWSVDVYRDPLPDGPGTDDVGAAEFHV